MTAERLAQWERTIIEGLQAAEPGFARSIKRDVYCYDLVDSTMKIAREAELAGEFGIFLAERQSAGRGRQGRSWEAAKSGLYVTFAIDGSFAWESLTGLSLVFGLSAREALESYGAIVLLKWPNDLVTREGRKLGGILIELSTRGAKTRVLAGIGINLTGAPVGQPGAVDLKALTHTDVAAVELASKIAIVLNRDWKTFLNHGFSAFQARWNDAAAHIGRELVIDLGETEVSGVHAGVDASGRLILKQGIAVQYISSGHVVRIGDASRS